MPGLQSKTQQRYYDAIHSFQKKDVNKAFKSGFMKAATSLDISPLVAAGMLKEAFQTQYKKKPSQFLRGAGITAAGLAGAYGLHRSGIFNKPVQPAVSSAPVDFSGFEKALETRKVEMQQDRADRTNEGAQPYGYLDQAANWAGKSMLGAATVTGASKIPVVGRPVQAVMQGAAKLAPTLSTGLGKSMATLGPAMSAYNQLSDDTQSDYWMRRAGLEPSEHPGVVKGVKSALGVGDATTWLHPWASKLRLAELGLNLGDNMASGVGGGVGLSELAQNTAQDNGEAYRQQFSMADKLMRSGDQMKTEWGARLAKHFAENHSEQLDKLVNPSPWERFKLNSYNLGDGTSSSWNDNFLTKAWDQLNRRDVPGQVGGDLALKKLRDSTMERAGRVLAPQA